MYDWLTWSRKGLCPQHRLTTGLSGAGCLSICSQPADLPTAPLIRDSTGSSRHNSHSTRNYQSQLILFLNVSRFQLITIQWLQPYFGLLGISIHFLKFKGEKQADKMLSILVSFSEEHATTDKTMNSTEIFLTARILQLSFFFAVSSSLNN